MNASTWNMWAERWWDAATVSTAQGLVLLAVVLALLLVLRRVSPLWRYALLLLVLAKLALPPIPLGSFSAFSLVARHAPEVATVVPISTMRQTAPLVELPHFQPDVSETPAQPATPPAPVVSAAPTTAPARTSRIPLSPLGWLLVLHACGMAAVLVLVWHESWRLRRMRRRAQRLTGAELHELASQLAARCRLSRVPALYLSSDVDTPQAGGLLHPFVILPGWVRQFSPREAEVLLAHELAHVARRDAWINWLQIVAQAWLWYNPAAWWINARIRAERELCCDDFVLGLRLAEGEPYGRALLAVAERMGRRHRLSESMGMADSFHRVRGRIERALNPRLSRRTRLSLASLVLLAALCVWILPAATPVTPPTAPVERPAQSSASSVEAGKSFNFPIKDESGKPVAGAEVALIYWWSKAETRVLGTTSSDLAGVASFKNLQIQEPYSLAAVARVPGKTIGSHLHYSLPSLRMRPFEITMVPSTSISGEVSVPSGYDPTRVAVYAITFGVRHAENPHGPALPESVVGLLPWKYRVSLNKNGRYVLSDLPSRGHIYLAAEGPGLGQAQTMVVDSASPQPDMSMYPEGVIEGTLRNVDGQPVGGIKVQAYPHRTGMLGVAKPIESETDNIGKYRITGLCAIRYNVGVEREQVPPDLAVAPAMDINVQVGQTVSNVDFQYHEGVVVQGTVRDSTTSEPLTGAHIVALREGQDDIGLGSGVTDASGNYAIRVPAGQVRLYISARPDGYTYPKDPDGVRAPTRFHGHKIEVRKEEGTRSELDFVLDRESEADVRKYTTAKGRVLDVSGKPLAGIPIREDVTLPDGTMQSGGWLGETKADGSYEVKLVVRGKYRVMAGGGKVGTMRSQPFTAEENIVHQVEDLTVQDAPSFIGGKVTDPDGNPIVDVAIRIGSEHNRGSWGMRTDKNGEFRIKNLVPEPVDIILLKDGYDNSFSRDVEPGKADHVFVLETKGRNR